MGNVTVLRRSLLLSSLLAPSAGAALLVGLPRPAQAAPMFRSLHMFVPANPGGGWDGLGRAIEQVAREGGLVETFQFENVGGAGGMVGLPRFISQRRNKPDSLLVGGSIMVGAAISNKSPYSLKDVAPIARLTAEAAAIVVPADSAYKDVGQFAAALKADPRAVPVAGGSAGGTDHIVLGQLIKAMGRSAKDANFVAFAGGGPAMAAILGGQVKAGISGWAEFSEQVKAGRLRALATSGEKRTDPNVPTLKESGLDVVATNWRGVFGPPGLKPDGHEALIRFVTALHGLPAWKQLLETRGWDDDFLAGKEFETFLAEDTKTTESVLKDLGLAA